MSDVQNNSAGDALRQSILGALREIETRLSVEPMTAADVHLARRAAKRARALARLAPPGLEALARNTRKTVGRVRRALGGARDAEVRIATLGALKPRLGAAHDPLARLAGADGRKDDRPPDPHALAEDVAALIRDWSLCEAQGALDDMILLVGATYRRARKRALASRDGESKALHNWRAAIVDFEYDADFLSQFAPDLKRTRRDADRLRKYLGEINDLDELRHYVSRRQATEEEGKAIRDLERTGAAVRARLLGRVGVVAEKLLALKPANWVKAVRRSCAR